MHLEAVTDGYIKRLCVNIPPGCMKPVHVDEPILTDRGFRRLADIRVGDRVLTHKGRFKRVTAVHEQGELPLVRVTTMSGRSVRAAPDHPFLTPRGWVAAGALSERDYVGIPRVADYPENRSMTSCEARLLGYLIGDGCLSQRSLAFVNMEEDVIEDFLHCAYECGFHAYVVDHPNRNVKAKKIVLRSSEARVRKGQEPPILDWLRMHGLYLSNSYTKRIPKAVFQSGPEALANFIGAYWSCDGMIAVRHVNRKTTMFASATTVSEGLAGDLQRALMVLNIQARVRRKEVDLKTAAQGDTYVSFQVINTERNEVAKIAALPGLCARKRDIGRAAFRDKFDCDIVADAVIAVEDGGQGECRCLTVEGDASFTVNGIAVHNSLLLNVFWPAWEWGPKGMPWMKYVAAAHEQGLAIRDNLRMRRLVSSDWYQERWPVGFARDQNAKIKFENEAGGFKQASAAGSVTGNRGNRVLIDDPHSVDGANSDVQREATVQWFKEAVPTRVVDPEKSAIIVIMQRLHEGDVSGVIQEEGLGYEMLVLPIEFDPSRACKTSIGFEDPRKEPGELLFPSRFPRTVVDRDKKVMGPYAAAGQLNQLPSPRGGGILKSEWWQLWDEPHFPKCDLIVASLDTAYGEDEENDPSALTIWGLFNVPKAHKHGGLWLPAVVMMRAWSGRLELHDLVEHVGRMCKQYQVDQLLIEAKASGKSVAQEVRRLFIDAPWTVEEIDPGRVDKVARAYSIQPILAAGMVWAPDKAWADMVIDQSSAFPKAKHDDLVDSMTQALRWFRTCGMLHMEEEIRNAAKESRRLDKIKQPPPLYTGAD